MLHTRLARAACAVGAPHRPFVAPATGAAHRPLAKRANRVALRRLAKRHRSACTGAAPWAPCGPAPLAVRTPECVALAPVCPGRVPPPWLHACFGALLSFLMHADWAMLDVSRQPRDMSGPPGPHRFRAPPSRCGWGLPSIPCARSPGSDRRDATTAVRANGSSRSEAEPRRSATDAAALERRSGVSVGASSGVVRFARRARLRRRRVPGAQATRAAQFRPRGPASAGAAELSGVVGSIAPCSRSRFLRSRRPSRRRAAVLQRTGTGSGRDSAPLFRRDSSVSRPRAAASPVAAPRGHLGDRNVLLRPWSTRRACLRGNAAANRPSAPIGCASLAPRGTPGATPSVTVPNRAVGSAPRNGARRRGPLRCAPLAHL